MEQKQDYKSLYFPDLRDDEGSSKSLTLAFSENENDLFNQVKHLSSHSVRKIIGCNTYKDLERKSKEESLPINRYCIWRMSKELKSGKNDFELDPIHTTFQGHKSFPLQSWYPYLEGYSPDFVEYIISNYLDNKTNTIYDPFSGTGTTPLTATKLGYRALYSEVNPLLQFLTEIKAKARQNKDKKKLITYLKKKLETLESDIKNQNPDPELQKSYVESFGNSIFFKDETFLNVLKTKTYLRKAKLENIIGSEILTVSVLSSLVENSLLKRQGDLRFRKGKELDDLENTNYFESINSHCRNIIKDLTSIEEAPTPIFVTEDARTINKLPNMAIDAVVTSPPYLNGTNYFRNTKIELWFLDQIKNKQNLNTFRRRAVTAGINDVSLGLQKTIENSDLTDLLNELTGKAYDKRIPKMVNDYFADMHTIFSNLKVHLNKNAVLAIDLGDSIYSGVHVKTDEILISVLKSLGYTFDKEIILRKRQSNNGQELKQVLLLFTYKKNKLKDANKNQTWRKSWSSFKTDMPHHEGIMAKRNWGDPIHSLCSYQGKLKPAIAHQLVKTFVPENGTVLDIFGGVGTIPLEAALQNKKSYSFDISPTAIAITRAKLGKIDKRKVFEVIKELDTFLKNEISDDLIRSAKQFGYNKKLEEYFHKRTLIEIVKARQFFSNKGYLIPEYALVMSAFMHILHGNRPYALSRRSHGITPFAPTGDFEYKNSIEKVTEKIERTLDSTERESFMYGDVYDQDVTKTWPSEIQNVDSIITSPPFFDSTRFYAANWMRLWFAGWNPDSFKVEPLSFIDELQKRDFSVYDRIFMQARERLNRDGVFVLHLGKSQKCDMAEVLSKRAKRWFNTIDIFEEGVENAESHGIKDRGTTIKHQYLVLN
jgi:tRNA G10  N-methylase Trm11